MDYGMSRLGRVNYRESSRSPFLSTGNELQREHSHSEQTAREIDQEVKRIIDESMEKVRRIVESRMASLHDKIRTFHYEAFLAGAIRTGELSYGLTRHSPFRTLRSDVLGTAGCFSANR